MITPVYNRTSSDCRMTAADMNRICANINEICGGSLKTTWTSDDIVDEETWHTICDRAAALKRYTITYDADYINVNRIERSLFDQYDEVHHITADPKLTGLAISGASLSPVFNSTTYSYTATVASLSSRITATTDYSAIGYKVNGSSVNPAAVTWQPGANTLQVTATLNGRTVTYTVAVTCTYQEAALTSLTIGGASIPVADFMTYQTENASDAVAYTANGAASMWLNGDPVEAGELRWQQNDNTLTIVVTADDVKTYTVAVDCLYQAPVPLFVDGINISDAMLAPNFSGGVLQYTVYPDEETSTIEVVCDGEVLVYFNGTEIVNGSEIEWTEGGGDTITVVTVPDGSYLPVTYTVTSKAEIETEPLAPMRSGEIIAGDILPGGAFA